MFSGKVQRQARAANLHSGSGLLGTAESRAGGSRLWAARAGLRLRAGIRKTYSDQHYTLFPAVAWVRRSSHTATPVCVVPCTVPAHSHGPVTPPANPEPSISPKEAPSPSAISSQPRPPSLVPGSPLPIPWTCHTRGLTPPPVPFCVWLPPCASRLGSVPGSSCLWPRDAPTGGACPFVPWRHPGCPTPRARHVCGRPCGRLCPRTSGWIWFVFPVAAAAGTRRPSRSGETRGSRGQWWRWGVPEAC